MDMERINDFTMESLCVESTNKGWLLVRPHKKSGRYLLKDPNSSRKFSLPHLPHNFNYFKHIVTAPPNSEERCLVFYLDNNYTPGRAKLLFCRPGVDHEWTKLRYGQFPNQDAIFTCNHKLFVLNLVGELREIMVFFGIDSPPKARLKRYNAKLSAPKIRLVDSCGELFAVGIKSIFDIDVFKMSFSQDRWLKVFKLHPDTSFALMGNSTASFSATELGTKENAIFFKEISEHMVVSPGEIPEDDDHDHETLYSFNLVDMSLSVWRNNNGRNPWTLYDQMIMSMSALRFPNKSRSRRKKNREIITQDQTIQESKESISDGDEIISESKWFQLLPLDVIMEVFQRLTVYDWMNFRAVCESWRSLLHPIQWTPNHKGPPFEYAWLMFPHGEIKGMYRFYDPIGNGMHCISIPELEDCKVRFSLKGWLLVTTAPNSIFFFEPFTRKKVQLPDLRENQSWFDGFCSSDAPTSSNWQILAIIHFSKAMLGRSILVYHLRSGEEKWTRQIIDCTSITIPSCSNPVFDGQNFCYLGKNGNVVFLKFSGRTRRFHIKASSSSSSYLYDYWRWFLVCYQDELISVCIDRNRKKIDVFKLDDRSGEDEEWLEVKSLDKKILYLSQTSSVVVEANAIPPQLRNTIQLSVFSDTQTQDNNIGSTSTSNACYSMKDGRFYTYNGIQGYSSFEDFYDIKEIFLRGTWIQPAVQPHAIWIN